MGRRAVNVPERLRRLPVHAGLPAPMLFARDERGVPDFTSLNDDEVASCLQERRCGLCGEPLEYWIAFVGGPLSVHNRAFTDPPMHEECARYALRVCPFLAAPSAGYAKRAARAGERPDESPGLSPERPERFALFITRGFEVRDRPVPHLRPSPAKRVEWFRHGEPISTPRG